MKNANIKYIFFLFFLILFTRCSNNEDIKIEDFIPSVTGHKIVYDGPMMIVTTYEVIGKHDKGNETYIDLKVTDDESDETRIFQYKLIKEDGEVKEAYFRDKLYLKAPIERGTKWKYTQISTYPKHEEIEFTNEILAVTPEYIVVKITTDKEDYYYPKQIKLFQKGKGMVYENLYSGMLPSIQKGVERNQYFPDYEELVRFLCSADQPMKVLGTRFEFSSQEVLKNYANSFYRGEDYNVKKGIMQHVASTKMDLKMRSLNSSSEHAESPSYTIKLHNRQEKTSIDENYDVSKN